MCFSSVNLTFFNKFFAKTIAKIFTSKNWKKKKKKNLGKFIIIQTRQKGHPSPPKQQ